MWLWWLHFVACIVVGLCGVSIVDNQPKLGVLLVFAAGVIYAMNLGSHRDVNKN